MARLSPEHKTLWSLIKTLRFGMLTHRHPDGSLHSQPLTTQNRSLNANTLYFFIDRASGLGRRIELDGDVNVAYADTHSRCYISVTGLASLNHELASRERLFNRADRVWFPGGPTDPQLELLQVKILHAQYWQITEGKLSRLFKLGAATVTGQPPRIGQHHEVLFD